MTGLADAGKTGVPQVSPDAIGTVSPISQSAGCRNSTAFAGLETRDTADLEVCGTGLPMKYPGWSGYFMTGLADAGKTGVSQVSPDAIGTGSPISQSAGCRNSAAFAGWETRDTADLEVCGTTTGQNVNERVEQEVTEETEDSFSVSVQSQPHWRGCSFGKGR